MKLYATVSSERASKGQEGNGSLHVEVKGEKKKVIFEFEVTAYEDCYEIEGYSIDESSTEERRSERYFAFRPTKQKGAINPLEVAVCLHNFQYGICKTCGWLED